MSVCREKVTINKVDRINGSLLINKKLSLLVTIKRGWPAGLLRRGETNTQYRGRLMLAASFISKHMHDVAFWHLADNRGTATFCPLLDKSGHWSALPLNAPVVNDPSGSIHGNTEADFPHIDIAEGV